LLDKLLVDPNSHHKRLLYSGLFVLLKQKLRLSRNQLEAVAKVAASAFGDLIYGNVRTFV
jgi:hypothetical protein